MAFVQSAAPSGLVLASVGEDALVRLWRVSVTSQGGASEASVTMLCSLRGHEGKHVWCVAAVRTLSEGAHSEGDVMMASGGADGSVRLWPIEQYLRGSQSENVGHSKSERLPETQTAAAVLPGDGDAIRAICMLDDSCAIAATAGGCVWAMAINGPHADSDRPSSSRLLHVEAGARWSKLHAASSDEGGLSLIHI